MIIRNDATVSRLLRDEIAKAVRKAGKHYRVTISIGCCRKVPDSTSMASIQSEAEQFLRSADQAMYLEKKSNS